MPTCGHADMRTWGHVLIRPAWTVWNASRSLGSPDYLNFIKQITRTPSVIVWEITFSLRMGCEWQEDCAWSTVSAMIGVIRYSANRSLMSCNAFHSPSGEMSFMRMLIAVSTHDCS
jgi:hypothetical protein